MSAIFGVMMEHTPETTHTETDFQNEIRRKGIHFLSAGIPIGYHLTDYPTALWVVGCLLGLAIGVEYIRMSVPTAGLWFQRWFGRMLRGHESKGTSGATYLLLAAFLCILIFHKDIAILCLFFLIFGDGVAALVGKRVGRVRLFGKSLEGTLAFAATGVLISLWFSHIPFTIRLTGAIGAALIELLPMRTSDNLRVPIISGSLMEVMYVQSLRSLDTSVGDRTVVETVLGFVEDLAG